MNTICSCLYWIWHQTVFMIWIALVCQQWQHWSYPWVIRSLWNTFMINRSKSILVSRFLTIQQKIKSNYFGLLNYLIPNSLFKKKCASCGFSQRNKARGLLLLKQQTFKRPQYYDVNTSEFCQTSSNCHLMTTWLRRFYNQ